jgi:hypothetical protein
VTVANRQLALFLDAMRNDGEVPRPADGAEAQPVPIRTMDAFSGSAHGILLNPIVVNLLCTGQISLSGGFRHCTLPLTSQVGHDVSLKSRWQLSAAMRVCGLDSTATPRACTLCHSLERYMVMCSSAELGEFGVLRCGHAVGKFHHRIQSAKRLR